MGISTTTAGLHHTVTVTFNLKNELMIQPGTLRDYMALDEYHYLDTALPPYKQIFAIRPKHEHLTGFPDPVAVIVYALPLRDLRCRTLTTAHFFKQPTTPAERMRLANKNILYIARLIVDPRYRRLGLAKWLLTETLQQQTVPIVETLAPVAITGSWLTHIGFKLYGQPQPLLYRRLYKAFHKAHINKKLFCDPKTVQNRINHLSAEQRFKLNRSIHHFLSQFRDHEQMPDGLSRTKYILSKIPYPNAYLIWYNPYIKDNPVTNWIAKQNANT